jgi:hypothetical protein
MTTFSDNSVGRQFGLVALLLVGGPAVAQQAAEPPHLVAIRVSESPTLDGSGNDSIWQQAVPIMTTAHGVMPDTLGTSTSVTLRAAYTESDLYLLATWEDATQNDVGHRTWRWDPAASTYVEDDDREDMFAVAFEHSGEFVADMLAGVEATWDVWHWKAFRTNPQGHAMDKTHRYTNEEPEGAANRHETPKGDETWIARPQDAGDSVELQQDAPAEYRGDRVRRYLPGTPQESAADVRASGVWTNGSWTLELSRRLDTGHDDDTAFVPGNTYEMAVSVHDETGAMDKASGVILLSLER